MSTEEETLVWINFQAIQSQLTIDKADNNEL